MPLTIKEIAFSGYPVTDFARSLRFYRDTLGLKVVMEHQGDDGLGWAEFDIGGAALCIGKTPDWVPSPHGCTVALEVEDFDAALAALREQEIKLTFGPIDSGVCRMAGFADPDGNPLMIHQRTSR